MISQLITHIFLTENFMVNIYIICGKMKFCRQFLQNVRRKIPKKYWYLKNEQFGSLLKATDFLFQLNARAV